MQSQRHQSLTASTLDAQEDERETFLHFRNNIVCHWCEMFHRVFETSVDETEEESQLLQREVAIRRGGKMNVTVMTRETLV